MKPSRKTGLRPAGPRKLWCLALTCALALALSAVARAEEPPYPVWWSPVLELESLDQIDARLERELWKGATDGMPLYKTEGDTQLEVWANSCSQFMALTEAGYHGRGNPGYKAQQINEALCQSIKMLKRASPARESYLRDFALNEAAIDYLPVMVHITPSCDFLCEHLQANRQRIPLSRAIPDLEVAAIGADEVEVSTTTLATRLSALARGDMNSDGLEDLLILSRTDATEGTGGWSFVFLLSREGPGAVLHVLEAQKDYCPNEHCNGTKDDPTVIPDLNSSAPE